jgi:hypothetical protein
MTEWVTTIVARESPVEEDADGRPFTNEPEDVFMFLHNRWVVNRTAVDAKLVYAAPSDSICDEPEAVFMFIHPVICFTSS